MSKFRYAVPIFRKLMVAAVASCAPVAPARAADVTEQKESATEMKAAIPFDFAFGSRIQSDYNFRGISQSNHRPSLQGYGELQLLDNLVYAGMALYQVDLPTRPGAEIDYSFGVRPKFGKFTFDFGVISYAYTNERRLIDQAGTIYTPANLDYNELVAKVSYAPDEKLTLGAGVFHAWNWLGTKAPGTYANLTAKYGLPIEGWSLSGELGHYWLGTTSQTLGSVKLRDYLYWNAGLSYNWKNFTIDLRYHDTSLSKFGCYIDTTDPLGALRSGLSGVGTSSWCASRFIATLSVDVTASSPGIFAPR